MSGIRHLIFLLLVVVATGLRAEEKPVGESPKSGNWLVDAMAGNADGSSGETKNARSGNTAPAKKGSRAPAKPEEGVVNPLSSYLTTWMTPRDIELLKAKDEAANSSGLAAAAIAGQPSTVLNADPQGQRPNPYVNSTPQGSTAGIKTPPTAPAPKPPASLVPEVKNDGAPVKTPGPPADVRKAQEESKYFPQLKRF